MVTDRKMTTNTPREDKIDRRKAKKLRIKAARKLRLNWKKTQDEGEW